MLGVAFLCTGGANARPETHRVTGFAFKNVQVHGCMLLLLLLLIGVTGRTLNPRLSLTLRQMRPPFSCSRH